MTRIRQAAHSWARIASWAAGPNSTPWTSPLGGRTPARTSGTPIESSSPATSRRHPAPPGSIPSRRNPPGSGAASPYYAVVNPPPPKVTYLAATDVDWPNPGYQKSIVAARSIYERLTNSQLLGPDPGLPLAKHVGWCRLCGQEAELTFEHFPPRSTGNNQRQRAYPFWAAHQAGEVEVGALPTGWIPLQRGIGAAVLCDPCNTKRTGGRLVRAYARLAGQAVELLSANRSIENGRPHIPATFRLTIEDSALGAVARQALVMLMAVSGGAALTRPLSATLRTRQLR